MLRNYVGLKVWTGRLFLKAEAGSGRSLDDDWVEHEVVGLTMALIEDSNASR